MHCDIVVNEWLATQQRRVGRITVDYPERSDLAKQWMTEMAERHDGSYLFVTPPHADEECPFEGGDVVAMKAVQ